MDEKVRKVGEAAHGLRLLHAGVSTSRPFLGPGPPGGRPCLWAWSHSLLPVCPRWEGCPVGPCGPWSEPGAGGGPQSVGQTPTASVWMCHLW